MQVFHTVLLAISALLTVYLFLRPIHLAWKRKHGSVEQQQKPARDYDGVSKRFLHFLSRSLFIILTIALLWSVYFMIVGLTDPAKTEYAVNATALIMSVATIFSIMMAFFQFVHNK